MEDIVAPGAFDEAVKGVDGVIHCAAPLSPADPLSDPAENIDPAVEGTLGILRSAHNATGIKRVVLTSSVVAARDLSSDAHVITEVSSTVPLSQYIKTDIDPRMTGMRFHQRLLRKRDVKHQVSSNIQRPKLLQSWQLGNGSRKPTPRLTSPQYCQPSSSE